MRGTRRLSQRGIDPANHITTMLSSSQALCIAHLRYLRSLIVSTTRSSHRHIVAALKCNTCLAYIPNVQGFEGGALHAQAWVVVAEVLMCAMGTVDVLPNPFSVPAKCLSHCRTIASHTHFQFPLSGPTRHLQLQLRNGGAKMSNYL